MENVTRDTKAVQELAELGWTVLICWECETMSATALSEFVEQIRSFRARREMGSDLA